MSVSGRDLINDNARAVIDALIAAGPADAEQQLGQLIRKHKKPGASLWAKSDLLATFESVYKNDESVAWLRSILRKKPVRSRSGITSITVLTKPFPCPGRCVFCPVDVRMPKSYIATEPGAQRAGRLGFDPYEQTFERLSAYARLGHPTSKIELIVLGGTWSAYPPEYQRWFIKRLFDALNDFGVTRDDDVKSYPTDWQDRIADGETYNGHINASQYVKEAHVESATEDEVIAAHTRNETAASRCVGLSLETRPDLLDEAECVRLRSLGATKIQIGIQSLDDQVLKLNKRGHNVERTRSAIDLLRRFGFKIQAHWMPNLYGSTPDADIVDYDKVFGDLSICPDELKVYPTALIQDTELETIANEGRWNAYEPSELNRVLEHVLTHTPEYCRLSRVIRDIPSFEILAGNKKGNLRQVVEGEIDPTRLHDIRAREIKDEVVARDDLTLDRVDYATSAADEVFLQFIRTRDRKIAGFLRLSLPRDDSRLSVEDLNGSAIIREVHVYGDSVRVGAESQATQHLGLGRALIAKACDIASGANFERIAVISAIGTRAYYAKQGFQQASLYQVKSL